jgi:ABC-type multidrug transport system fused ATPase/permease subunit
VSVTSIRETARAWLTVYGIAARAWPFGAIARPLMSVWMFVTAGVIPGIALQQLLTAAAHRQAETALAWTAVLVTAGMSRSLMSALWNFVQSGLMWRTTQAVTQALMTASVAAPGIEHLENPAYADHMETARNHAMRASLLVDWVASAVGDAISVIAAAVILLRVQPFGAALAGIAALRTRSRALAFMAGTIPDQRLARRLASLATSRAAAEDIRLLGLSGWLRDRHRIVAGRVSRRIVASERGPVAVAAVGALIQALMLAVGVAILAVSTAGRPGAVGTLALGIVLLQAALVQAGMLGVMGADLAANTFAARRLLWLLNHRPLVTSPTDPRPVPAVLRAGIVVDGVSFAYPWGDGRPALGGVRFTLRAGTTVALVGDNGAGESTASTCAHST